jgi:hypothetical protein
MIKNSTKLKLHSSQNLTTYGKPSKPTNKSFEEYGEYETYRSHICISHYNPKQNPNNTLPKTSSASKQAELNSQRS